MLTVTPNLSVNLGQLLQKAVHLNDLQYDYFSKYLAAACRSQTGPEVVIFTKDSGNSLTALSTFATEFEPLFVSWAPPAFGTILIVVSSDNSLTYYRNDQNCQGLWKVIYKTNQLNPVSSMAVGSTPISSTVLNSTGMNSTGMNSVGGELVVALGSLTGSVTLVTSCTRFETTTFKAHTGPVYALAFSHSNTGELLMATGGIDNTIKLWEITNNNNGSVNSVNNSNGIAVGCVMIWKFELELDVKRLGRVNSLCWSREGLLAGATESHLYIFQKTNEWTLLQNITLGHNVSLGHNLTSGHNVNLGQNINLGQVQMTFVAFNNDRIVLLQDSETVVFRRNDAGTFEPLTNTH